MSDKKNTEEKPAEIAIIDERTIRDKIYEVRGVKVMLDFDLAEIYGFSTSAFNQQVKRNAERFDDDFRFQLTREEVERISISQIVTSIQTKGVKGGRSKLPWAFTQSGIYMLMTVLKGDLAIQQSKALIRIFQAMKDYIIETQGLVTQRDLLRLSMQTAENTDALRNMHLMIADQQKILADQQRLLLEHDDKLVDAFERINETVKQSDISPVMFKFDVPEDSKEYLIREGMPVKADVTYMDIYSKASKSVYLIDNYINIKTLRLLQSVKPGVTVTVFSDNLRNHCQKLGDCLNKPLAKGKQQVNACRYDLRQVANDSRYNARNNLRDCRNQVRDSVNQAVYKPQKELDAAVYHARNILQ